MKNPIHWHGRWTRSRYLCVRNVVLVWHGVRMYAVDAALWQQRKTISSVTMSFLSVGYFLCDGCTENIPYKYFNSHVMLIPFLFIDFVHFLLILISFSFDIVVVNLIFSSYIVLNCSLQPSSFSLALKNTTTVLVYSPFKINTHLYWAHGECMTIHRPFLEYQMRVRNTKANR